MLKILSLLPQQANWPLQTSLIMITCNLFTIAIGRYAIRVRGLGPSLPISNLQGFGLAELIATTSLGHIIGAGIILGINSF